MSRHYRHLPPPRGEGGNDPLEIIELTGQSGAVVGTPVDLVPIGPDVEILEGYPVPRLQLRVVLHLGAINNPTQAALVCVQLIAKVLTSDRKLRLSLAQATESGEGGELTFLFTPTRHGVEIAGRLEMLIGIVREVSSAFQGVTLIRTEVIPQK